MIPANENYYWIIPSSTRQKIEDGLKEFPFESKHKLKLDMIYFIIDYLVTASQFNDPDSTAGYINLNASVLQEVKHDYRCYLDWLLERRIIVCDRNYTPKVKSRGYKLNIDNRIDSAVFSVKIIDNVFVKRKKSFEEIQQKRRDALALSHGHLTKWLNESLIIDANKAIESVYNEFPIKNGMSANWTLKPIKNVHNRKRPNSGNIKDRANQRFRALLSIYKLEHHHFHYTVDKTIGRLHSNLTNLKKELRNYITYDGQQLINIDIKNSQPLLTLCFFNDNFFSNSNSGVKLSLFSFQSSINTFFPFPKQRLSKLSAMTNTIMLVKSGETGSEFDKYQEMVNSGRFYNMLFDTLYPSVDLAEDVKKKQTKEMFYTIIFSNNRSTKGRKGELKKAFEKVFPTIYKLFKIIKRGNHRSISNILSRLESHLIIEVITRKIAAQYPDLPIFTIHDSIVTTNEGHAVVEMTIKAEFKRLLGLSPKLGIEYWN